VGDISTESSERPRFPTVQLRHSRVLQARRHSDSLRRSLPPL